MTDEMTEIVGGENPAIAMIAEATAITEASVITLVIEEDEAEVVEMKTRDLPLCWFEI